jgi:hypothetical protein
VASFKLHIEDRFEASSANPRHLRNLARSTRGDYDRLILIGALGLFVGAVAGVALQFVW